MKAVVAHDTAEALTAASRRSGSGRVAHRLLAIRDVLLGQRRSWVCKQYGVSRENLRHWVSWYNDEGIAGLEDAPRAGRPPKLSAEQLAALKQRVSVPPDIGRDGVGRWRAADVQRLIKRDYGVEYRSLAGVCQLLHRLKQAWISGRPKHPQQATDAVASFKKNSRPNSRANRGAQSGGFPHHRDLHPHAKHVAENLGPQEPFGGTSAKDDLLGLSSSKRFQYRQMSQSDVDCTLFDCSETLLSPGTLGSINVEL
jgi:transposase